MAFTDDFAEALGELEDPELVPSSFRWPITSGNDYPCFASGATRGGKLEEFGFARYADLVIVVRGAVFGDGARPLNGHKLSCKDVTYKIETVLTAPGGAFLRLICVDAAKGA